MASSLTTTAYSYAQEISYVAWTWTLLFLFIIYFVRSYASPKSFENSNFIYVCVCLAYMCSFGVLILIPMDLGLTNYRREASSYQEFEALQQYNEKLIVMYQSLYWPGLVLGSFFLVISSEYLRTGYLSFTSKMLDILKRKAMIGIAALIFCIVVVIILLEKKIVSSQKGFLIALISLNNTIGLFAIVFLLGFGLIELPKQLWYSSSIYQRLKCIEINAAHEFRKKDEAYFDLLEIVSTAYKTCIEAEKVTKKRDLQINKYIEGINNDLPPSSLISKKGSGGEIKKDKHGFVTVQILANIRANLNKRKRNLLIAESRCVRTSKEAFYVQDLVTSQEYYNEKIYGNDDNEETAILHDGTLVPFWQRRVFFGSWIGKIHKTANYENLKNRGNGSSRKLDDQTIRESLQTTNHLKQTFFEKFLSRFGFNNDHSELKYYEHHEAGTTTDETTGVESFYYLAPNPDDGLSYTDDNLPLGGYSSTFRYHYEVHIRPIMYRGLAIFVFCMSLTIIISQAALIASPASNQVDNDTKMNKASFLALLFQSEKTSYSNTVFFGLFFLLFLLFILSFSLSNLHVASAIEIVPDKATDALSMIFHSRLCVRLAAPLAFNFLTLCYESGVTTNEEFLQSSFEVPITNTTNSTIPVYTAFDTFYGNNVQFLPFLGNNFNTIVPIFILVFASLHLCNLLNRGLAFIGLRSLQFGQSTPSKEDYDRGVKKLEIYREKATKEAIRHYKKKAILKQSNELRNGGWKFLQKIGNTISMRKSTHLKKSSRESIDTENPLVVNKKNGVPPYTSFGHEEFQDVPQDEMDGMDNESRLLQSSIRLTRQSISLAPYAGFDSTFLEEGENENGTATNDSNKGDSSHSNKRERDSSDVLTYWEGYIFKLSGQKSSSKAHTKTKTFFKSIHKWQKRYFSILGSGYLVYYTDEPQESGKIPKFELNLNKIKNIQPHDGKGKSISLSAISIINDEENGNEDSQEQTEAQARHLDITYVENSIYDENEEIFTLSLQFEDPGELPMWITAYDSAKRIACRRQSFLSGPEATRDRSGSLRRSSALRRNSVNRNSINPRSSVKDLNSITPHSSVKDRNSISPRSSVKDRNSSNPRNSVKDRNSINSENLRREGDIEMGQFNSKTKEPPTSQTKIIHNEGQHDDDSSSRINFSKTTISSPPPVLDMLVEKRSGNKMRGYQPKKINIDSSQPTLFLRSISSPSSLSPRFGTKHDYAITLSTLEIEKVSNIETDTRIMLRSTEIKSPKEGLKIKTKTADECDSLISSVKAWNEYFQRQTDDE